MPVSTFELTTPSLVRSRLPCRLTVAGGFPLSLSELAVDRPTLGSLLDSIRPDDRGLAPAALLGDLNAVAADLSQLNEALEIAKVPYAVERRKR